MSEKICHECGKEFAVYLPTEWVYRVDSNNLAKFFCSYTCWTRYKAEVEQKRRERLQSGRMRRRKKKKEVAQYGEDVRV